MSANRVRHPIKAARRENFLTSNERPSADVLTIRRDVALDVSLVGRTIAGLAEAGNMHLLLDPDRHGYVRARNLFGDLSAAGQMLVGEPRSADVDEEPRPTRTVVVPRSVYRHWMQQLSRAALHLESARTDALPMSELVADPGMRTLLTAAFRDNVAELAAADG